MYCMLLGILTTYQLNHEYNLPPLGFLRRNLFSCPQDVKEAAYKTLVRPILEYGSTVWDPRCNGLIDELENVQKRAARFVTRN